MTHANEPILSGGASISAWMLMTKPNRTHAASVLKKSMAVDGLLQNVSHYEAQVCKQGREAHMCKQARPQPCWCHWGARPCSRHRSALSWPQAIVASLSDTACHLSDGEMPAHQTPLVWASSLVGRPSAMLPACGAKPQRFCGTTHSSNNKMASDRSEHAARLVLQICTHFVRCIVHRSHDSRAPMT